MTEVQILDIMYEAFQLAMKLSLAISVAQYDRRCGHCCFSGSHTDQ